MISLLFAAAVAGQVWADGVLAPPKQYDHVPPYPVVVLHLKYRELRALCPGDIACTIGALINGNCVIALPDWDEFAANGWELYAGDGRPVKPSDSVKDHLYLHERGHCNGWAHTETVVAAPAPTQTLGGGFYLDNGGGAHIVPPPKPRGRMHTFWMADFVNRWRGETVVVRGVGIFPDHAACIAFARARSWGLDDDNYERVPCRPTPKWIPAR